jgi:parvulin-like peptidyl-prolyl isomerase
MLYASRLSWSKVVGITLAALLPAVTLAQAQDAHGLPPGMIARQGDRNVTLQEIDAVAQKIPEKDRAGFFDSPKRIESLIMNLLLQKQLAAEARAAKLDKDPLVQIQIQQATEETLARADVENYRQHLKLPDFDVLAQEHYQSNKADYVVPGPADVEHVLVSTKSRSEVDAKARIGEVETTAQAHPDQFKALVEKYSDDPGKQENHGLIEDASSANMAAPLLKAARDLKNPGDVSPIIKTDDGFHVLKLVARKPGTQRTFAEVRQTLIEKLRNEWIEKQTVEHTGQMRGNALDANPDLVASLRTRYVAKDTVPPSEATAAADAAAARKAADKDRKAQH